MNDYEHGFAAGERQSFIDRRLGGLMKAREAVQTQWQRGFWDAYLPRSEGWANRSPMWAEVSNLEAA